MKTTLTSSQLPIIAVIPNYNMAASLQQLLPQLLAQEYEAIYVLDDASTDNSVEVARNFDDRVRVIAGATNIGAGGNRNRILNAHRDECIIHFLDADTRLESTDVCTHARQLFRDTRTAFVGGLVLENGRQHIWNYGPNSIALYTLLTATIQNIVVHIQAPKPRWRNLIRLLTRRARRDWPDPAVAPKRRSVYWAVEGNLLVRRSTLEQLGGFDETVFEYDIIPPARKAYQQGLISYFDPAIAVTHLKIDVRHYHRGIALYKELYRLIKRYGGWKSWVFPDGHFRPKYNK